jgi:hypothetical protein
MKHIIQFFRVGMFQQRANGFQRSSSFFQVRFLHRLQGADFAFQILAHRPVVIFFHVAHQVELAGAFELAFPPATLLVVAFDFGLIELAQLHHSLAPVVRQLDIGQVFHDLPFGVFSAHHLLITDIR